MGLLDSLKKLFNGEEETEAVVESGAAEESTLEALDIDEEDKIVVALAASAMAGKDKPDSHFHITSIKRIK